jgi:membrane-anchored protein YejM (alkaline phosphatase superfamily)
MIFNETPRRIQINQLVSWGHWFAFFNMIVAILIASIYVFAAPTPTTMLAWVYLAITWVSHLGFLSFFIFVILILPLCYLVSKPNLVRGISAFFAASGLTILAYDGIFYAQYGVHIGVQSAGLIGEDSVKLLEGGRWIFLLVVFCAWFSFQLIASNALWKRIDRFKKCHIAKPAIIVFTTCFTVSHLTHIWADAKLYQPIIQQDNLFPLSYPATAKTLMSKYGLLDIDQHNTKKYLQFSQNIHQIRYPSEPVYCDIDRQSKVVLLVQTDGLSAPDFSKFAGLLPSEGAHFDYSSNSEDQVFSALFGLPQIYQQAISSSKPLMLDLPQKLQLPVRLYAEQPIHYSYPSQQKSWQDFLSSLTKDEPKLAIGFVNQLQMNQLVTEKLLSTYKVLISVKNKDDDPRSQLWSNMTLSASLSSIEDLAPTLIAAMGCYAETSVYATGQSLINPSRQWLITTRKNWIYLLHDNERIAVKSNGNYVIDSIDGSMPSNTQLDTQLFGLAMKRLNAFTAQ